MGCGLSRFRKAAKPVRSGQSVRPLASLSDEEEAPLLMEEAVREECQEAPAEETEGPKTEDRFNTCSQAFMVKVCGLLSLAMAIVALVWWREPLGEDLQVFGKKLDVGSLGRFAPGPCLLEQMQKTIEWMIRMCIEHWTYLLLCGILVPMLLVLKKCLKSAVQRLAGDDCAESFFAKAEVAEMLLFWSVDMLSDAYVTYKYCKQRMYIFATLMILIWFGSGCLAFGHRFLSWERCKSETNIDFWAQGMNEHGEPRPGLKSFVLYVVQLQPLIMAWDALQRGMTRRLHEEKMLAALTEGAPSSLLQIYAMLLAPPAENWFDSVVLCGSIATSILQVAIGTNKAYELCIPDGSKMEQSILPTGVLLCFRWCDSFARIGVWALLGMCLRPLDANRNGVQQPYLPLILVVELLMIGAVFKSQSFGLNLPWPTLMQKEYFVSVMSSFLGIYWCCNTADLAAQHRLSRSLFVLRLLQTLGTLWLCSLVFSASVGEECLVAEQPAVVIITLLVLVSFTVTFVTALAHDVAMSIFAVPLFPVIAGKRGGRLELAARLGVASQIPHLLQVAEADDDAVAALCQAALAGQVSVIHSLVDGGVSETAAWHGKNVLHWAAEGGHVCAIQALQARGDSDLERVDADGWTPALFAAWFGHLGVLKFLHTCGCSLERASNNGSTPAFVAARNGHLGVLKFLHTCGCSLERADNNGWTPAIVAAQNGHLEVLKFLHTCGCSLERADNKGWTPAIFAALSGRVEVLKFLDTCGCSLERADHIGYTAAICAAINGHLEVVKFLHSSGCNIGVWSLYVATAGCHLNVVEFLLDIVDVNAVGIGRLRALDIARAEDPDGRVTEALLRAGANPGAEPRLVGLTALKPPEPPRHGYNWFTCGAPLLAQSRGAFYHEIQILSDFVSPQLGWLSTDFEGGEGPAAGSKGQGVGDDSHGWAFDGQKCCWWHDGRREPLQIARWKVNDILGFAIDLDQGQMQLRTKEQELTMCFQVHGAVQLDVVI